MVDPLVPFSHVGDGCMGHFPGSELLFKLSNPILEVQITFVRVSVQV